MALPVYDADKHHVGLGDSPSTLKGFTLAGGARAMLQNAPQVTEFGSSRNLVDAPSLSRWTQDDFLGGAYWPTWHSNDPTTWSSSRNYIASQQGRSLRSVPPFVLWDDETGGTTPGAYLMSLSTGDYVVTVFENKLVRTKLSDKTRTEFLHDGLQYRNRCVAIDPVSFLGVPALMVYRDFLGQPTYSGVFRIRLDTWVEAFVAYTNANSFGWVYAADYGAITGIIAQRIFSGGTASVVTWLSAVDDAIAINTILRLGGSWQDSVAYNGLLYILSYDQLTGVTRVSTCDGGALTMLMEMPYNFIGVAIQNYAGSIWVLGYGADVNNTTLYAELHQITGNTSRLVKTFSPENQLAGLSYTDVFRVGHTMMVWEGLLWMGGDYDRLVAYDVTTDALYGASTYDNASGVLTIKQLAGGRSDVFGYATHSADATKTGWYRIARSGDTVSSYSSELVTSDFDPEPALDKRWAEVHLLSRYDDNNPTVDYSTDGGTTWVSATVSVVTSGTLKRTVASLASASVSRQIRLRFRFPRGTNVTNYQELMAYTVTFSFLDSGKRSWVLPVIGADRPELEDYTYPALDLQAVEVQFWAWIEQQTKLTFVDLDGQQHSVQLVNLQKMYTEVGAVVDDGYREGYYHLSLVEV